MTMHVRMMLATAIAALAAASGAAASGPPGSSCGTINVAGRSWLVLVHAVPCGSAKKIIGTLAARPVPNGLGAYPGSFQGMRCVHMPVVKVIICGNAQKHIHAAARS
jgi:hypothetical protein